MYGTCARAHHYLERARGDLGLATAFTRCSSIRTIKDNEPLASHRIHTFNRHQLWIMYALVLSNLLACILASCLQTFVASASAGTYLTLTECIELVQTDSAKSGCFSVFYKGMWCAFASARYGMCSVSWASARTSCVCVCVYAEDSSSAESKVSWEGQRQTCAC